MAIVLNCDRSEAFGLGLHGHGGGVTPPIDVAATFCIPSGTPTAGPLATAGREALSPWRAPA